MTPGLFALIEELGVEVAHELLLAFKRARDAQGQTLQRAVAAIHLPEEFHSRFTAELEATAKE